MKVLAERYAKALLELGLEEKSLERFQDEMARFSKVLKLEPRLLEILALREIDKNKRKKILEGLMLKLYLSPPIQNFLKILLEKGRILLFPEITLSFEDLVRRIDQVVVAKVSLADKKSTGHLMGDLQRSLEKMTGKKVECHITENPGLIGGLKVTLGDRIFDASIQGELERIREEWKGGVHGN